MRRCGVESMGMYYRHDSKAQDRASHDDCVHMTEVVRQESE